MSTEEINQETAAPETAAPPTPDPETPETTETENDVGWNDVPDPEDESNDKSDPPAPPEPSEEGADQPVPPESNEGGSDQSDDPFSFLDDLDRDPDAPPASPSSASQPIRPIGPSGPIDRENPPAADPAADDPAANPPAPSDLASFDIANLIDGLAEGDLKDFAANYPEETKMAAAMTLEILKKLGYDQLRTDLKKFSGAAEQFGRSQQEIQARAAQTAFENAVMKVHPDVRDIVAGAGQRTFAAWLKGQPRFLQQRFRDTHDPEEAIDIISRYKDSRSGQRTAQRKRASQFSSVSASSPRSRSNDEVSWNDVKDEDVPEY